MSRVADVLFANRVWKSVFRHGYPSNPRNRAEVMFQNVFLHIQSVKVFKRSLRVSATFGLGLILAYLFLLLTLTGFLLMFYYVPEVHRAYSDMKDLEFAVSFGVVLRNMHRWGAHAMVLFTFLHMARIFFTGAYKAPREFNWSIGVILLIITLFLSLSGYLLPWDQLAYWAITIVSNLIRTTPPADIMGAGASYLVLGGTQIGQNTLIRFYVMHVFGLPAICAVLMVVHFWRIRKDGGLARPDESNIPLR